MKSTKHHIVSLTLPFRHLNFIFVALENLFHIFKIIDLRFRNQLFDHLNHWPKLGIKLLFICYRPILLKQSSYLRNKGVSLKCSS